MCVCVCVCVYVCVCVCVFEGVVGGLVRALGRDDWGHILVSGEGPSLCTCCRGPLGDMGELCAL